MEIEKLAGGLALAALSGLTFLAYKHPKAYGKLQAIINPLMVAMFMMGLAWDASNTYAFSAARQYITPEKINEAMTAVHSLQILDWKILVGYFASMFYLGFLLFLPLLIEDKKPNE